MIDRDNILSILQANHDYLFTKYHLVGMELFGSVACGDSTAKDIDLLIDCDDNFGIYDLFDLEDELKNLLKAKVDVVFKFCIQPYFKANIADDLIAV